MAFVGESRRSNASPWEVVLCLLMSLVIVVIIIRCPMT